MLIGTTANGWTYKGRVIDADTKQPIEGLVVVAVWNGEQGSVTGGTSRTEAVKEVLSDKNGEWSIKGPIGTRSRILRDVYTFITIITGTYYTTPPMFVYFKPGYCSYPGGYSIPVCRNKIKFDNNTLELPKLLDRRHEILTRNNPFIGAKAPIFEELWKQDIGYVE